MATIYATSNAREVSAFFIQRADGVRLFGAAASATLAKAVKDSVLAELQHEAPRSADHRGNGPSLADSFSAHTTIMPGGAQVDFASEAPYADFVLHGTGIYHVPDAHQAWDVDGPQAFMINGTMIYTTHTHHEGQHADDYVGRALDAAQPAINVALRLIDNRLTAVFV